MRTLGIDEAGRGCVLGPLVVGAFLIEDVDEATLAAAGAADSKRLSAKRRRAAREALSKLGTERVTEISAAEIDGGNLNTLEEAAIITLVKELKPDRVIVDALGHPATIPKTLRRLADATGLGVHAWLMEPKADHNHRVVGAASIVAKTTRDAALAAWAEAYGDLGSGYPSDPKTRAWLTAIATAGTPWPPFVRTRWETIRALSQTALL
jgi:ribonuclease HII